jgi:hypothetical protein
VETIPYGVFRSALHRLPSGEARKHPTRAHLPTSSQSPCGAPPPGAMQYAHGLAWQLSSRRSAMDPRRAALAEPARRERSTQHAARCMRTQHAACERCTQHANAARDVPGKERRAHRTQHAMSRARSGARTARSTRCPGQGAPHAARSTRCPGQGATRAQLVAMRERLELRDRYWLERTSARGSSACAHRSF